MGDFNSSLKENIDGNDRGDEDRGIFSCYSKPAACDYATVDAKVIFDSRGDAKLLGRRAGKAKAIDGLPPKGKSRIFC